MATTTNNTADTMNFEQFRNTLFSAGMNNEGRLDLSTEYSGNSKNSTRKTMIHDTEFRTYDSIKYTDHNKLTTVNVRGRYYIVLSYFKWDSQNNRPISEDIYVSLPGLRDLGDFFQQIGAEIAENYSRIWNENGVSPEYADKNWTSPTFTQGKQIMVAPTKFNLNINNVETPADGMVVFIGNESNYVVMTTGNFISLASQVVNLTDMNTFMSNMRQDQILAHLINTELKSGSQDSSSMSHNTQSGFGSVPAGGFGRNNSPQQSSGFNSGGSRFSRSSSNHQQSSGFNGSSNGFGGNNSTPAKPTFSRSSKPEIDKDETVTGAPVKQENTSLDDVSRSMDEAFSSPGHTTGLGNKILSAAAEVDSSDLVTDADMEF